MRPRVETEEGRAAVRVGLRPSGLSGADKAGLRALRWRARAAAPGMKTPWRGARRKSPRRPAGRGPVLLLVTPNFRCKSGTNFT